MKELAEKLKLAWEQVQESSAYQALEEKYISLPLKAQKAVQIVVVFVGLLLVLMPSYSFFSSSQTHQAAFLKDRQLMRDLLLAAGRPRAPIEAGTSFAQAQQLTTQLAQNEELLPEQITPPQPGASSEKLSNLKQQVFEWSLKQLTLTQLVNLGQSLDKQSTLKLMGLNVQASQDDPHYFDVRFKVVHFELPAAPPPPQQNGAPPKGSTPPRQPPAKGTKSSGLTSPKPPHFNPAQGVSS